MPQSPEIFRLLKRSWVGQFPVLSLPFLLTEIEAIYYFSGAKIACSDALILKLLDCLRKPRADWSNERVQSRQQTTTANMATDSLIRSVFIEVAVCAGCLYSIFVCYVMKRKSGVPFEWSWFKGDIFSGWQADVVSLAIVSQQSHVVA